MTQGDLDANPDIQERLLNLLKARLEKGKMTPFYKINMKMWNWMCKNKISYVKSWAERRYKPIPEGYVGLEFRPKKKAIKYSSRGSLGGGYRTTRHMTPETFYLELPSDLCEKALLLGEFP